MRLPWAFGLIDGRVPPSPEGQYEELRMSFLATAERVAPEVHWSVGERAGDLVARRLLDVRGRLRVGGKSTLGLRWSVSFRLVEDAPEVVAAGMAGRLHQYAKAPAEGTGACEQGR
jgi:hypothetical protein